MNVSRFMNLAAIFSLDLESQLNTLPLYLCHGCENSICWLTNELDLLGLGGLLPARLLPLLEGGLDGGGHPGHLGAGRPVWNMGGGEAR